LEVLSKQPIKLSEGTTPAVLGISRIWTSASHRHQKIARRLLDVAYVADNVQVAERTSVDAEIRPQPDMQNGNHEQLKAQTSHVMPPVPKLENFDGVAFSQPTETGTRLARKWFGKTFGWKVYVD
jgi:N-acetyltransferase